MTTLEKIREEIEEKEKNTIDWSRSVGLIDALEIIDKYAEQAPCEECEHNDGECCRILFERSFEQEPCRVKNELKVELNELEPCDDVVSRQAVLDVCKHKGKDCIRCSFYNIKFINERTVKGYCTLGKAVRELPSVRPQEQTGTWIMNRQLERRTCDNCNTEYRWSFYPHNFCPNCGARMVEPTCDTCEYNTAALMPCNECDDKSEYKPRESERINCKSTKCENCQNHNYCDFEPQESEE